MGRIYILLECGCLISCDGGGGLIPVCHKFDKKTSSLIPSKNCKVKEYLKKHKFKNGCCQICHKKGRRNSK